MSENISDQTTKATQKGYLPNGTKYASEDELEGASESCERWSFWCGTLVIVSVLTELIIAFIQPPYDLFLNLSTIPDAGIAVGIVGEVLFAMRNNRFQTELRNRSNDKLSNASDRLAEAENALARVALRRISHDQLVKVKSQLSGLMGKIDLLIEHQYGDVEAFIYARDLSVMFLEIAVVRIIPNALIGMNAFGLFIAASPTLDIELIAKALSDAGIEFGRMQKDLSTHLPRNVPAPNLYIFVAPKPPPPLISPAIPPKQKTVEAETDPRPKP
jgi:hypothetical protein